MAPQAEKIKKRASRGRSDHTPADLIRLLVGLTSAQEAGPVRAELDGRGHRSEEIIFEADLDGARYILMRLPNAGRPRVQLSPREQEIVRMVADGHSNKVIAEVLSISSWTVCTHLRRIFAKLGVGSRAAMVARLLEIWSTRDHSPAPDSLAGGNDCEEPALKTAGKSDVDPKD